MLIKPQQKSNKSNFREIALFSEYKRVGKITDSRTIVRILQDL
jgi:hypothetical protein